MHCGAEVTESSTNKQHHPQVFYWQCHRAGDQTLHTYKVSDSSFCYRVILWIGGLQ